MPKWTPGPWEWDTSPVDYDPEQTAPWLVSTETAKYPDCAILQGQIKCSSEANARLIAAAPDLLEALRDILAALGGEGHDGWHSEPVHSSDVKMALNAIAKATGESA